MVTKLVCWYPATHACKAHLLRWSPWDPAECVCACACVRYTYVVVPLVSVETRIMCMRVYYTLSLTPRIPLCSYHWNINQYFPLHIICTSARFNSVYWRHLPSDGCPWNSKVGAFYLLRHCLPPPPPCFLGHNFLFSSHVSSFFFNSAQDCWGLRKYRPTWICIRLRIGTANRSEELSVVCLAVFSGYSYLQYKVELFS